jgi:hypothetical protein
LHLTLFTSFWCDLVIEGQKIEFDPRTFCYDRFRGLGNLDPCRFEDFKYPVELEADLSLAILMFGGLVYIGRSHA